MIDEPTDHSASGRPAQDGRRLLLAPTVVYLPITLALVVGSVVDEGVAIAAAMLALGVGLWTVGEYVVHRFVQHGTLVDAKYIQNHLTHHADPWPAEHFVYTLGQTLPIVPLVFGEAWLVSWDLGRASGVAAGIIGSYLTNEWVHFVAHRPALARGVLRWMAGNHLRHHHTDASRHFGFFTSFWDRLLGTHRER